jgi:hypothetical protein
MTPRAFCRRSTHACGNRLSRWSQGVQSTSDTYAGGRSPKCRGSRSRLTPFPLVTTTISKALLFSGCRRPSAPTTGRRTCTSQRRNRGRSSRGRRRFFFGRLGRGGALGSRKKGKSAWPRHTPRYSRRHHRSARSPRSRRERDDACADLGRSAASLRGCAAGGIGEIARVADVRVVGE